MSENVGSTNTETRSAAECMKTSYANAREAARNAASQAREKASEYYSQGREKAAEYGQKVEDMVREQPIKSVLIAAGAGLLLGMLLRRR